jgi:hypothetical protein
MGDPTSDIRAANLALLMGRFDKVTTFAKAAGMSTSHVSQLTSRTSEGELRSPLGEKLCRKLETRFELPRGWFDQPQASAEPSAPDTASAHKTVSLDGLSDVQVAMVSVAVGLARKGNLPDHECIAIMAKWQDRVEQS